MSHPRASAAVYARVVGIRIMGILALASFTGLAWFERATPAERMSVLGIAIAAGGYLAGAPRSDTPSQPDPPTRNLADDLLRGQQ